MIDLIALALLGAHPAVAEKTSHPLVLTVIGFEVPPDDEVREVVLEEMVICTNVLVTADKILDEQVERPALLVTLNDLRREELARITSANVGSMLRLSISGKEVMRPMITEGIRGGKLQISGPNDLDFDDLIHAMQQDCPTVRSAPE